MFDGSYDLIRNCMCGTFPGKALFTYNCSLHVWHIHFVQCTRMYSTDSGLVQTDWDRRPSRSTDAATAVSISESAAGSVRLRGCGC